MNQGTADLLSLQTHLKKVENKQNKELADLKKHLFDISPINSVLKIIHEPNIRYLTTSKILTPNRHLPPVIRAILMTMT